MNGDSATATQWRDMFRLICQHFRLPLPPHGTYESLDGISTDNFADPRLAETAQQLGLTLRKGTVTADPNLLPFVTSMDNQLALAEDVTPDGQLMLTPADGTDSFAMAVDKLSGPALFVTAQRMHDVRGEELLPQSKVHWMWETMRGALPYYRDLLVGSFVVNLLVLMVPLFTMNVYDRIVPNQAMDTLWVLASGVTIALVFDWLLRNARSHITDIAGRQIDVAISTKLFQKVVGMKLWQRPQSTGAFAKQLQEADSIRDFLTSATLVTLVDMPYTIFFLALITWLGGWMVFIPIGSLMILLIAAFRAQPKLKECIDEIGRLSAQRQAQLIETLQLLTEYKQLNQESILTRRWKQVVGQMADQGVASRTVTASMSHLLMFCQYMVTVGLLLGGVYRVSEGLLSMGGMIAIVMLSGRTAQSMAQIAFLLVRYTQTRAAITGLDTIMDLEQEPQAHAYTELTFTGKIQTRDVCYRYSEQPHLALDAINLTITPGERIAILGPSGSGKSTLLAMLAGQLDQTTGVLYYDSVERNRWPLSHLRERMGWMPQAPLLAWGTILENITGGKAVVDEEELRNLITSMGIDQMTARLSNGLQSPVGEWGRELSGGQRQLIAMARAMLGTPLWLLLDEPTSSMDDSMEKKVTQALAEMPKDRGFIVATHTPAMLNLCDRVIVLSHGKIMADQSHADFLAASQPRQPIARQQGTFKPTMTLKPKGGSK